MAVTSCFFSFNVHLPSSPPPSSLKHHPPTSLNVTLRVKNSSGNVFFSSSSTLITVATSQCDVARLVPAGVFVLSFTFVCLSVCLVSHSFYSSVCQTDSQSIGERGNEKRIINLYIRSNIVNGSQLIQHNFFLPHQVQRYHCVHQSPKNKICWFCLHQKQCSRHFT